MIKSNSEQSVDLKRMKQLRELHSYQNMVTLNEDCEIDEIKTQIQEIQQQNSKYKVWVDFESYDTSLQFKLQILDLIEQMNINDKVTKLTVGLRDDNQIDIKLINRMGHSFDNLCSFAVFDGSTVVDKQVHQQVQQIINDKIIFEFGLVFYDGLQFEDEAFLLIKQYNQIVEQKRDCLELLWYEHTKINKILKTKSEIYSLITLVKDMP